MRKGTYDFCRDSHRTRLYSGAMVVPLLAVSRGALDHLGEITAEYVRICELFGNRAIDNLTKYLSTNRVE